MKRKLFEFVETLVSSERGRSIVARSTEELRTPDVARLGLSLTPPPYPDLPTASPSATNLRSDPIFITARFRSGSTFLWNIFRSVPGMTAYYEPFNERRWFDPAQRGARVDSTHRNVDDYWREYEGLDALKPLYQEEWTRRRLFMEGEAWDPRMQRFIEILIEQAPGRPVLQFNRVDFRLPWLKKYFPQAKLIHLYRHPRDQWCSTLLDEQAFGPQTPAEQFIDHFYLQVWVDDLRNQFPFLRGEGRHPYESFYLIWRMSLLFGQRFADYSLSFENLLEHPDRTLREMFQALGMNEIDLDPLKRLLAPPRLGKWRDYAEPAWFGRMEERCESMLRDYLSDSPLLTLPRPAGAISHATFGE